MMRPRHVLMLLAVAAVPIGLAVALTAGSGGSPASGNTGVRASLHLDAGGSASGVRECGIVHHYRVYGSSSTIKFRGLVSPAGTANVKVKVKLKMCTAGAFQPSGEATTIRHANNIFKGSFPAPTRGYYYARAEVERSGVRLAKSDKRYFEVR
jgi:hypothetical protein